MWVGGWEVWRSLLVRVCGWGESVCEVWGLLLHGEGVGCV